MPQKARGTASIATVVDHRGRDSSPEGRRIAVVEAAASRNGLMNNSIMIIISVMDVAGECKAAIQRKLRAFVAISAWTSSIIEGGDGDRLLARAETQRSCGSDIG